MTRTDLIRSIQIKQNSERAQRCRRIVRAINGVTIRFHDQELSELEEIVERAYGRTKLSSR